MESSSGQVDFAAVQRRKTADYLAVVAEARHGHATPKGLSFCLPHFSVRDLLLALMKPKGLCGGGFRFLGGGCGDGCGPRPEAVLRVPARREAEAGLHPRARQVRLSRS